MTVEKALTRNRSIGYRASSADQPKSLSVIGIPTHRVPYRRLGVTGLGEYEPALSGQIGQFWVME
jgi:hypothetical protein